MIDDVEFVAALYRGILSREPDQRGLETHLKNLRKGTPLEEVARLFVRSAEFSSRFANLINMYPLDRAPPMRVDLHVTEGEEKRLWDHVATAWSRMGASEPYWSVLANPQWKMSGLRRSERLDAFYSTGRSQLNRLDSWFSRSSVSLPSTATCAEYGCGVGRCTIWLAKRYARVIAFDVSEPHLKLARAKAESEGITNIEFVHVRSKSDLDLLRLVDLFYSDIVLQHNPPPLIVQILEYAFAGLRAGGLAYFQVPTYAKGYSFNTIEYLHTLTEPGMEMHFVPQSVIFSLAFSQGMKPLEALPDGAIGHFGEWISTCFLLKKSDSKP